MTPAKRVAEARAKLWDGIVDWATTGSTRVDGALRDFAAAVRAESFEEVRAEAERRFDAHANMEPGYAVAYGRLADWAKQQAEKASGR